MHVNDRSYQNGSSGREVWRMSPIRAMKNAPIGIGTSIG